jgi:multicomponent Na+:H+ antiporter subunit G
MIGDILDIVASVFLVIGSGFALVGALGVLRFPDVYTRTHAASKAGTLGAGMCLVAVALSFGAIDVATRAIAGVVFFMLTAPVSAHLLARAAFMAGYPAHCQRNAYLEEVDRQAAAEAAVSAQEDPAE